MNYMLKGEEITIQVRSKGAELFSLKDNRSGQEYMWCGDPAHWSGVSPILFPFVGKVRNGVYRYQGKTYEMGPHGFARHMEFDLLEQKEDSLWLVLRDSEETLEKYPFHFTLELGYELSGRVLKVLWRVRNENDGIMYFSIGGHPAFACPLQGEGKRTNGNYLLFDTPAEMISSEILIPSGMAGKKKTTYKLDNGYLPITTGIFDGDALVMEHDQIHRVALCGPDKKPYVSVAFDAPLFGVWSMPQDEAGYICIEPWYGRCDGVDFDGELPEREWGNVLEAGGCFERGYTIEI